MKKGLTLGVAAAITAALPLVDFSPVALGGTPALDANAVYVLPYERGPRIIHVPQPDERDGRAGLPDREAIYSGAEDDDAGSALPLPRTALPRAHKVIRNVTPTRAEAELPQSAPRATPHVKPHVLPRAASFATPRTRPRWGARSDTPAPAPPPPAGPRRAILSAPPPSAQGPTPIRPTPRFGAPITQVSQPKIDAASNAADNSVSMSGPNFDAKSDANADVKSGAEFNGQSGANAEAPSGPSGTAAIDAEVDALPNPPAGFRLPPAKTKGD